MPKLNKLDKCCDKLPALEIKQGRSMIGTPWWRGRARCRNRSCKASAQAVSPGTLKDRWNKSVKKNSIL